MCMSCRAVISSDCCMYMLMWMKELDGAIEEEKNYNVGQTGPG